MGFFDGMKGANFNFGEVDSPDFPGCYLTCAKGLKTDDGFAIVGTSISKYEFTKQDIKEFKCVAAGATWIKYKITFNDGKSGVITSHVIDPTSPEKKNTITVSPIDRFFGDLL